MKITVEHTQEGENEVILQCRELDEEMLRLLALGFGWFRGIPLWSSILLTAILEFAIVAMLYAMWLEKRRDTRNLNRSLKEFQGE